MSSSSPQCSRPRSTAAAAKPGSRPPGSPRTRRWRSSTHATASRVLVSRGRAVGVASLRKGREELAYADGEVVLSGGAVNSPKLLLLSGIGPADELRSLGIEVVHDLPGVGKDFQAHMDVYLTAETAPVSYNGEDRWHKAAVHGAQYLLFKTGPVTACVAEAGAFLRSNGKTRSPTSRSTACRVRRRPRPPALPRPRHHDQHVQPAAEEHRLGHAALQESARRPRHRSELPRRSLHDCDLSITAFKRGREILHSDAFEPLIKREHMPGADVTTDAGIRGYIRKWGKTDYHPAGSCKMGCDEMAVVDIQLHVRGMEGLRVIDASIMPTLISGNTQAPSIMIGEKGAAIMRAGAVV